MSSNFGNIKIEVGGNLTGKILFGDETINNSYNNISNNRNIELVEAFKSLEAHIVNELNPDEQEYNQVKEAYRKLLQQVEENKEPNLIKETWGSLVAMVPSIKEITDVVKEIKELFI